MQRNVFLAALATAAVRPEPSAAAGATPVVLALGDSLALGTGATRADGGFIFPAYRRLLRTRPAARLDNAAIGGSTVADVVRLQTARIAAVEPQIVVICVGGNDVVRRTSRAAFARDYARLLAAVRRDAPAARIICCGVPDVAVSPLFADERAGVAALSAADDDAVRRAARASGAAFVDFYSVTHRLRDGGERFFSRDRFHPSDAGYARLSDAFWPALRDASTR